MTRNPSLKDLVTNPVIAERHQHLVYPDYAELNREMTKLAKAAPLTTLEEIDKTRDNLKQVAEGKAILLQGGLCAEDMDGTDADAENYAAGHSALMQNLAHLMMTETGLPVASISRAGGQVAKPRSAAYEKGTNIPTYHGGIAHGVAIDDRTPDPRRLNRAYAFSEKVGQHIKKTGGQTGHELLWMLYEVPLIQTEEGRTYAGSGTMLWGGHRTNDVDGPQVNFLAMIENPVGLKCGPGMKPEKLMALVKKTNPYNTPGKLILIFRFGADKVDQELGPLLDVAAQFGSGVISICDPMHGNTKDEMTSPGTLPRKTRYTEDLKYEVTRFNQMCQERKMHAGGMQIEISHEDVTEIMGDGVYSLNRNYRTSCDPCLNPHQGEQLVKTDAVARGLKM